MFEEGSSIVPAVPDVCMTLGTNPKCAESEATGSQHCGVFVFDSVVVEDEEPGYCTLLSAFQLR